MDLSLYTEVSPYFALLKGKDEQQEGRVLERVVALPEETRGLLADETTAQRVVDITRQAGIDMKFGVAIAKLIGLRVLGDVQASTIGTLLERVGISKVNAQSIAASIEALIAGIPQQAPPEAPVPSAQPAPASRPTIDARPPSAYKPLDMALRQLPPLTQQIPEADSAPVPQRNIIDLRTKPPEPTA